MTKPRRRIVYAAAILLVLTAALAAALHWASRSERVLRWGLAFVGDTLPCALRADGVSGSLTEPIRIDRLSCTGDALAFQADQIVLDWSPWELRHRRLRVSRIAIDRLVISVPPGSDAPPALPASLALPVGVSLGNATVREIEIRRGDTGVALHEIAFSFDGGTERHALTLAHIGTPWGSARGEASVTTRPPFVITGAFDIESATIPDWPLRASVAVSGPLARPHLDAAGTLAEVAVAGSVVAAPFEPDPLPEIRVRASDIDLARWVPGTPRTALAAEFSGGARGTASLAGTLSLRNAVAGTLDDDLLPVTDATATIAASPEQVVLDDLRVSLGQAGRAVGSARLDATGLTVALRTDALDLKGLHGALRQTHLSGTVAAGIVSGKQQFSVDLRQDDIAMQADAVLADEQLTVRRLAATAGNASLDASGTVRTADPRAFAVRGTLRDFDPSRFGRFPEGRVAGKFAVDGHLTPDWSASVDFTLAPSALAGRPVRGSGHLAVSPGRVADADVTIVSGSNRLAVRGGFGRAGDALAFTMEAPKLQTLRLLGLGGAFTSSGRIGGTLARPDLDIQWSAAGLRRAGDRVQRWTGSLRLEQGDDPVIRLVSRMQALARGDTALASLDVDVSGPLSRHGIELHARGTDLDVELRTAGSFAPGTRLWSGTIQRLSNAGRYPVTLEQPAALQVGPDQFVLGRAALRVMGGNAVLEETRFVRGTLDSSGSVARVPVAMFLPATKQSHRVVSTLTIGGRWSVRIADDLQAAIDLGRESGDLAILSDDHAATLDLSEARLAVRAANRELSVETTLVGRGLRATGQARTTLSQRDGRWGLAGSAPLAAQARIHMDSIAPAIGLIGTTFSGDGTLDFDLKAGGTLSDPSLAGALRVDRLRFERIEYGVLLHDGSLRARLSGNRVILDDFAIRGGDGRLNAKGTVTLADGSPGIDLGWQAEQLAAIQHPDLLLVASGGGKVTMADGRVRIGGALTIDRGRVDLGGETSPSLGDDVVVAGRDTGATPAGARPGRPEVDLRIDLGPDFRVSGRGVDARLAGALALRGTSDSRLQATGQVDVASGTYRAYDRQLEIEKGVLYFSGPVGNPGLEIRALRKNQSVEAGVEITGTARNPRARLVSNPEVPDAEKLSWLVLGRAVESAGTADADKLQGAAVAMAAGLGTAPLQRQLAKAVGLDELRLGATTTATGQQSGLVTVGKRIGDRIYIAYEQTLTTAESVVRVSYQISRNWSIRTESGRTDAVDLFYTLSFD